ncbi:hypothetical protein TNCV_3728361 [Trichonephila clavipes]|nr:hypothetical protein TNCV_3728361 [Trichonephila clavipes]
MSMGHQRKMTSESSPLSKAKSAQYDADPSTCGSEHPVQPIETVGYRTAQQTSYSRASFEQALLPTTL